MADWPEDMDLEHIFQKGTEQHSYPFDESAWTDMERLLDGNRKRKAAFWLFGGLGSIILVGTLLFGMANPFGSSIPAKAEELNKTSTPAQQLTTSTTQEIVPTDADHPDHSEYENSNDALEDNNPAVNAQPDGTPFSAAADKNKTAELASLNSRSGDRPSSLNQSVTAPNVTSGNGYQDEGEVTDPPTGTSSTIKEANVGSILTASQESKAQNNASVDTDEQGFPGSSANGLRLFGIDALSTFAIYPLAARKLLLPVAPDIIDDENSDSADNLFGRFGFAVFGGLESSWTANGEYSGLDASVGLRTSYLLTDRMALTLALGYRVDKYTAGPNDYNTEDGFWANGAPDYTDADCQMIELATGVEFAPNGFFENGFVFGGSLISNFMLHEKYEFHYADPSLNFERDWTSDNQTWLSNLEISTGYQHRISPKLLVQFSPYIKVPLNGIGHGNLMLSSLGARTMVKF
ncbi:MAG: hypothetical protein AAFQ02_02425 [Bacteroidota bacterium]